MEEEFKNGSKSKVVAFVKVYNFGVLSFQSFHIKFKVILIFLKSRICPLLILNSHFKIQKEFKSSSKNKVVDLFFLSNFSFYRFSSCYVNFGEKEERRG
jgi:hypothetical protein